MCGRQDNHGVAHGIDGDLVGRVFIAQANEAVCGNRRGFGDTHGTQYKATVETLLPGHKRRPLPT